jgi:hypothetical protein
MNDFSKRVLSFSVFGLGMAAGLFGCVAVPGAIFVIGVNDSKPEILALLGPITLLPACILALWKRTPAGLWLVFLGLLWAYGMFAQRHYMETVRHFPQPSYLSLLKSTMVPTYLMLAIGLFSLLTERAKWPKNLPLSTIEVS